MQLGIFRFKLPVSLEKIGNPFLEAEQSGKDNAKGSVGFGELREIDRVHPVRRKQDFFRRKPAIQKRAPGESRGNLNVVGGVVLLKLPLQMPAVEWRSFQSPALALL